MRSVIKEPKVTWIDIQNPTREDVLFLEKKFNFHPLVLGELIPPGHRHKVEYSDDYLFMTFYYPIYNKEKRETRPRELDIIVTKDTLITSHYHSILPLKALFDNCRLYPESRKNYMGKGPGHLLFYILSDFWKNSLTKIERISKRIDDIERDIFLGKEKEMVLEISLVKTDIINFWRIIEPQEEILESLAKEGVRFFGEKLFPHLFDLLGIYGQTLNGLKTYKETILALEDTNQSLLSTKTNEIIKILTIFSVVLLPLTLLATMWGTNFVSVPLRETLGGFWIMVGLMIVVMGFMILYFKKKRWL